jgi:hypothetical protein
LRDAFPLLKQLDHQPICDAIRRRAHCHVATSVQNRCPKLPIFLGPLIGNRQSAATRRSLFANQCSRATSSTIWATNLLRSIRGVLIIGASPLGSIDRWRADQEDTPTRAEAIRRLINATLTDNNAEGARSRIERALKAK